VESYDVDRIRSELGLNRSDLIMLSLLLGSDYDAGIRGVGIVNAIEIVNAFATKKVQQSDGTLNNDVEVELNTVYDRLTCFRKWLESNNDEEEDEGLDPRFSKEKIADFSSSHRSARRSWGVDPNFPNRKVLEEFFRPQVCTPSS
jgi:DNA excision repair protein ERCC-5